MSRLTGKQPADRPGLVVLAGVAVDDTESDVAYLVNKVANLRIFADESGKFNLSAVDIAAGCWWSASSPCWPIHARGGAPASNRQPAGEGRSIYPAICRGAGVGRT